MPPDPAVLEEVHAWFRKAEADLRNIELVLPADDCPFDTACFHAQQAAEKYLKGYLTYLGVGFPKAHDLEELVARLPASAALHLDDDALAELTQLAVAPRYPGWDEAVDRPLAERALATARAVKDAVLVAIDRRG